jgi:hypothetical protein
MEMSETFTLGGALVHISTSVVATISLSATGSRKAPNDETSLSFRAKKPSAQSVIAARMKMAEQAGATQTPCM